MSDEPRFEDNVNPFASPTKARTPFTPTISDTKAQQPDVLATADLLLEQLKELENLCSTVEERVQRKRRALKELEYLILGSNSADGSPRSPRCPTNTPIGSRTCLVSPRLRGLFDLRGPGQVNLDAIQTCLDYSPEAQVGDNTSTHEDPGHSEEWVDDDEEALLSGSPFDDKYALRQSPRKVEKKLPAVPREMTGETLESKIPRKVRIQRQGSTSRRAADRPPGAVMRNTSQRRRPSVRNVKATNGVLNLTTKGTMRRGSWKRSIVGNTKIKGSGMVSSAIENETARDSRRRKRKGLWSIYSVCSDLGLSGTPRAI